MDIYHSFWENGYNHINHKVYLMHKLSVLSTLKSHGNIHLITTETGKKFLGGLPYTSIELYDEEIDTKYQRVWAISKLLAYKQILKKNKPFLHIDYDVFLFKKLPERVLNGNVICQQYEGKEIFNDTYGIHDFKNHCKNKYLYDTNIEGGFNTGIFGGNDLITIKFFLDEAFKLLFDKENEYYWCHHPAFNYFSHTVMIEQHWLNQCLKYLNIEPTLLFDIYMIESVAKELGYTHLMGAKNNIGIENKIENKIRQYESF